MPSKIKPYVVNLKVRRDTVQKDSTYAALQIYVADRRHQLEFLACALLS
jgi:hypothetical protein